MRGFDIRSIGPQDPGTGLVLGGNKSLLFNIEQNFNIMSQFRIILFYDAGQVRDAGQPFALKEKLTQRVVPPLPILFDPAVDPRVLSRADAFVTTHRQRVQDLDRRRGPAVHAGHQRAVPAHFCL